jgi:hypothetical protein
MHGADVAPGTGRVVGVAKWKTQKKASDREVTRLFQ